MKIEQKILCPFCDRYVEVHSYSQQYWFAHGTSKCPMRDFMAKMDEDDFQSGFPNIDFHQFDARSMRLWQIADALVELDKTHNLRSLIALSEF